MTEQHRIIRWEQPPKASAGVAGGYPRYRAGNWDQVAAELIANPGRAAVVNICPNPALSGSQAYNISRGRARCFEPAGAFDACARKVDGQYLVYAWYVGGDDE